MPSRLGELSPGLRITRARLRSASGRPHCEPINEKTAEKPRPHISFSQTPRRGLVATILPAHRTGVEQRSVAALVTIMDTEEHAKTRGKRNSTSLLSSQTPYRQYIHTLRSLTSVLGNSSYHCKKLRFTHPSMRILTELLP